MKESEWADLVVVIGGVWGRPPITPVARDVQYRVIADVSLADAQEAVAEMSRDGREHPPTAGQIVRMVREKINLKSSLRDIWTFHTSSS